VTIDDAAKLIAGARVNGTPETWADLGCGDGTFTLALASILARGSVVHAMDRDGSALQEIPHSYKGTSIVTHDGDFTLPPWPFSALDGVLLANSLHYVRDQSALIRDCRSNLKAHGRFLVVEYDTDKANPWVPYPISVASLERLFAGAGYPSIQMLGTRRSIYQRARIYAALVSPVR
jgi:ubiquinone/menaquinone biosynthesis C-methylase UbiE